VKIQTRLAVWQRSLDCSKQRISLLGVTPFCSVLGRGWGPRQWGCQNPPFPQHSAQSNAVANTRVAIKGPAKGCKVSSVIYPGSHTKETKWIQFRHQPRSNQPRPKQPRPKVSRMGPDESKRNPNTPEWLKSNTRWSWKPTKTKFNQDQREKTWLNSNLLQDQMIEPNERSDDDQNRQRTCMVCTWEAPSLRGPTNSPEGTQEW